MAGTAWKSPILPVKIAGPAFEPETGKRNIIEGQNIADGILHVVEDQPRLSKNSLPI